MPKYTLLFNENERDFYDTVEEAFKALDVSCSSNIGVYEVTRVVRPAPEDYIVVYEDTKRVYWSVPVTLYDAQDITNDEDGLMVMKLVPVMEGDV